MCDLRLLSRYNESSEFSFYAKTILALDTIVKTGDIRKCVGVLSDEVPKEILRL